MCMCMCMCMCIHIHIFLNPRMPKTGAVRLDSPCFYTGIRDRRAHRSRQKKCRYADDIPVEERIKRGGKEGGGKGEKSESLKKCDLVSMVLFYTIFRKKAINSFRPVCRKNNKEETGCCLSRIPSRNCLIFRRGSRLQPFFIPYPDFYVYVYVYTHTHIARCNQGRSFSQDHFFPSSFFVSRKFSMF